VVQVETKSADAFAHIVCEPVAGIDRHTQLLILLVDPNPVARPDDEAAIPNSKADILSKRRLTESTRDKTREAAKESNAEAARKNPQGAGVR
jgi:rod shape-determining protein MreC